MDNTKKEPTDWRLRASPEMRLAIEKIAEAEDRSLCSTVRMLVKEALRARNAWPANA